MKNKPLISVIVALYNSDKYLEECLNSLINQTYPKIQIIIVNDASSDNSLQIANKYAEQYNNIKVISLQQNVGYLSATNIGFENSNGEYITFLDSDDISDIYRIEKQLNYLVTNRIDLVGTNCTIIDEKSNIIRKISYPSYKNEKKLSSVNCCGSSVFFKKEILSSIGIFNPLFSRIGSEDFEWLLRCSKKYKFENMKDYLYFYRKSSNSITMDLNSIYSLERAISHNLAEMLVKKYSETCFNNYWDNPDVMRYFFNTKSELIKEEQLFPISSTTRQANSLIFQKNNKAAISLCYKFMMKFPLKLSSYKLLFKMLMKISFQNILKYRI